MYADKSEIALKALGNYEIMGFLDNDVNKEGTQFGKYKVFKPDIKNLKNIDQKENETSIITLVAYKGKNILFNSKILQKSKSGHCTIFLPEQRCFWQGYLYRIGMGFLYWSIF